MRLRITASLSVALKSLGLNVHHYNLRLTQLLSAIEPESYPEIDWPQLLSGYDAVLECVADIERETFTLPAPAA